MPLTLPNGSALPKASIQGTVWPFLTPENSHRARCGHLLDDLSIVICEADYYAWILPAFMYNRAARDHKAVLQFYFMSLYFVALTIGGNKGVFMWLTDFSFSWWLSSFPKLSSVGDRGKSWRFMSPRDEVLIFCIRDLTGKSRGSTSLRISYEAEQNHGEKEHGG